MADSFLDVSELFYSLQGESTRAGLPCLFIRLAGCNLRCTYCDSRYTWEEEGEQLSIDEILAWTDRYPGIMVELTGGEPLLQKNSVGLMHGLVERGRTLLVETNGSVSIADVPDRATVILDIKCPDSGMDSQTDWQNIERLARRSETGSRDEIKFVLTSTDDFFWAKDTIGQYGLDRIAAVLFSPVDRLFPAAKLAQLMLDHRMNARLQLQLHRIIWPEHDRGV